MIERISAKQAKYRFDSLADVARYLETQAPRWPYRSSQRESYGQSWDLGTSYKEAWQLARGGWNEGAKRLQKALKAFRPKTPAPENKTDFYGHMPHVARYCAGAPDAMIRRVRTPQIGGGRVLTLYVPVNAVASVDAKHMANFGLGVAQYIYQLELEGVRVELWGVICSEVSGMRVSHTWLIKRASQPLDLAVVSFAIGHPAMFRRLGFALRERSHARPNISYGMSVDARLTDLIDPAPGAVILNGMREANRHARTPEQAQAYITRQIEGAMKQAA